MHFTTPSVTQNVSDSKRMLWKEHAALHATATGALAIIPMTDKAKRDSLIATPEERGPLRSIPLITKRKETPTTPTQPPTPRRRTASVSALDILHPQLLLRTSTRTLPSTAPSEKHPRRHRYPSTNKLVNYSSNFNGKRISSANNSDSWMN